MIIFLLRLLFDFDTRSLRFTSQTSLQLGPRFAEVWVGYLNIREYHRPIFTGWLNQQLLGVTKSEFKYQMFRPYKQ